MRSADHFSKEQKQKLEKSPKNKENKEQFSTKDIEELMGINQPTYKRVHGAVRRK